MAHEHDNVVSMTHVTAAAIFPQDSSLYFPVVERPDGWQDKKGEWHVDDTQKKLVRVVPSQHGNQPRVLATVGSKYRMVKNVELFPHIENRMTQMYEPRLLKGVETRDMMSYNGRDCYREYIFPQLRCDVPHGGDIAFRLIVGNSYGGKAVQLICGAIDFFCTNGMIIGAHERVVRKHTKGLSIRGLDDWITQAPKQFTRHTDMLVRWSREEIPADREKALFEHLVKKELMGERQADQFRQAMYLERRERRESNMRPSLWSLFSSLTAWASHGDVRNTGNDHAANTRLSRERFNNHVMAEASAFIRRAA